MRYLPDWSTEDDDLTRTRKWDGGERFEREITDVMVHPDYAVGSVTEEMPIPAWVQPTLPPPPALVEAFPSQTGPFESAPNHPRVHSAPQLAVGRKPYDSDTGVITWKKTVPALRQMIGLPVVPGWRKTPPPPAPVEAPNTPAPPPSRISPVVSIAMAVCLVAMVLMAIVGLGSRAREASRRAHIRVVSATAPDGSAVTNGRVFVDGGAECDGTPCELELTPGVHWITVRAPGFETPPSRSVNAGHDGEPMNVAFDLVPERAPPPVVAAAPAPVPPASAQLALAAVALPAPPTQPAAPITAPPGPAESPRTALLRPAALGARLNINSIPASTVVVDGRPAGQTPVMGLKVKPGPHTVVLIGPGGNRAVRSTAVGAGKTATVAVRF